MPGKVFKFEVFKFLLLPFFAMALVVVIIAYLEVKSHNDIIYNDIIEYSTSLVEIYTRRLDNYHNLKDIIIEQIDDKMFLIADQVIANEDDITNEYLDGLVSEYDIDEINIYNNTGVLVYSHKRNLIGFKSYEGHTVYDFLMSDENELTEDIRVGEIDEAVMLKLILKKTPQGKVIQVGVSVERLNSLLETFGLQKFIDDYSGNESIDNIFFTDQNYTLVATGNDNMAGITFDSEDIHKHFQSDEAKITNYLLNSRSIHACVPVIYKGERIGTLTVVWSANMILQNIYIIIRDTIIRFVFILLILGTSMFYGYKKRKDGILFNYTNYLTGLPNDIYLKAYLEERIKHLNKNNLALIVIKLNNLDAYNSSFGLEQGDILLKDLTQMLSKQLQKDDILFKFGGSKYVLLVNSYPHLNYANEVANNILYDFNDTSIISNKEEFLKLYISINIVDNDKITVKEILDESFLGLELIEKENEKGFIVLVEELKNKKNRELKIEHAIKEIINNENNNIFSLNFQPVYQLNTDRIHGLEALSRMKLENLGPISPIEFIGIAEEKQLIYKFGLVILKEALNAMRRIDKETNNQLIVSINISRLQLYRSDFIESITNIVEGCKFDWNRIVFEITETAFVKDYLLFKENILKLKEKGSKIALDDFGTDYSTLSELRNLNLDYLKIDKFFIDNIGTIEQSHLITENIIQIGKKLGLGVVAEGIETAEQLQYLKEHGCELGQGYYLSKPLTEKDIITFLKKKNNA